VSDAKPIMFYPSLTLVLTPRFDSSLTRRTEGGKEVPLFGKGGAANTAICNVVPKAAEIELPGHRQAGKFSATIDFRDLPIDPRALSACGIEVHLGVVNPSGFAEGMLAPAGQRVRASTLRTVDDPSNPWRNTLVMVGSVDAISARHTSRVSEITIEGRDARGILLDSPLTPQMLEALDLTADIGAVVGQVLALHPVFKTNTTLLRVVTSPAAEWPTGAVPSPATADGVTRVGLGAVKGGAKSQAPAPASTLNFWDIITQYCFLCGAVPHFVGRELRVTPTRGLFTQLTSTTGTPFWEGKPRDVGGRALTARRMVYGHNIDEVTFDRKLAGRKQQPVEVVSLNTSSGARGAGRLLKARYPAATPGTESATDQTAADKPDEAVRITVKGISDQQQLQTIAQATYEEIMRGEMGGSVRTRDLTSFGGDGADCDLLRLRPGDAIELGTMSESLPSAASPVVAELLASTRPYEEVVARVTERVGDEHLAALIVASARGQIGAFSPYFYTSNVRYSWDAASGIAVAFDFYNYVEARAAAAASADPSATSKPSLTGHPTAEKVKAMVKGG
jgi:hypothetical protein